MLEPSVGMQVHSSEGRYKIGSEKRKTKYEFIWVVLVCEQQSSEFMKNVLRGEHCRAQNIHKTLLIVVRARTSVDAGFLI